MSDRNMGENPKVLVIDDEPVMHSLIGMILESEGFEVMGKYPFTVGPMAAGSKPNLIILDLMMPEVDGFDILEELKRDDETRHIPVIICSIRNFKEDIERALDLGAEMYIVKPFEPSVLVASVKKVLNCE